jgi:NAD(P)H-hydrate epimerase
MEHLPEALYRAADTRTADRRAAAKFGLGGGVLMERAGAAAFALLRERFPRARRIAVVCGPGNNGGDGYVVARLAQAAGLTVQVLSPSVEASVHGDAGAALNRWIEAGGAVQPLDAAALQAAEVVVDALFGTGLERPLEGAWRAAVEAINACGRPVLALDIPSGLHADSGRVLGVAARATVTLSFIGLKAGMFTAQGREHAGLILFDDLAVPAGVFDDLAPLARRITAHNLRSPLAPRARHAHKGDAGRVLVVGGQPGMPGAARLAGEAAYRAGAGLVTIATHAAHAALISSARPEIIAHGVNEPTALSALLDRVHAVAVGPGLGRSDWAEALWQTSLESDLPMVVDADALRWLAARPQSRDNWVVTPHPGEAAALLGASVAEVEADRFRAVRAIAQRYGGVCVLKGSGTLVAMANGEAIALCDRGNPGLATGGSGDVLTGAIAALLAQGLPPLTAARLGVWAHATAGDRAARAGERGLLASDLFAPLRAIINDLVDAG